METLPAEIIELILGNSSLSIEDILNSSLTCSHFKNVVQNSYYIWKNVYLKTFHQFKEVVDQNCNWFDEVKYIFESRMKTRNILMTMSGRFYSKPDLSNQDFKEWVELIQERACTYDYVVDYLAILINNISPIKSIEVVPLITPGNKTLRYYCLKILQYLRQIKITLDFKKFISAPEKSQLLEIGAVIIAQWCQPEVKVEYRDVCTSIDKLTTQARDELKHINPEHPLFKVPENILYKWKIENLEENQFNGPHSMQIVDALKITLFHKNKFSGNISDFYMPQNSYINVVLDTKYGLPITLSILYESIARRMGVNCEPMNIPAHFLLRFQPEPYSHSVLFIDAFNEGQLFPRGICPHSNSSPDKIPRATAYEVIRRMASNLEESLRLNTHTKADLTQLRSVLELLVLITPNDMNCIVNLSRLCISLNLETEHIEEIIKNTEYEARDNAENILQLLQDYDAHRQHELFQQCKPKQRDESIKYAVGMVMKHKSLNYKGVITDWSPQCKASVAWQKSMNVEKLLHKADQPFYNVIVEDGTQRYVAEENIELTTDTGFLYLNEEIGRHFSHFFETHYVPNSEKEKEYPEDARVRHQCYQNMLFGS